MRRHARPVRLTFAALALVATPLSACGSDSSAEAGADPAAAEAPSNAAIVLLDVRDPSEFAAGHLEGALNYSYEQGALEVALSTLDPAATYQVYCRSGRRSELATELLLANGFTNVTDLGAIDAAAASTGLAVVVD